MGTTQMARALLIAAIGACCLTASALELKGMTIGMSQQAFEAKYPGIDCHQNEQDVKGQVCLYGYVHAKEIEELNTVGGATVMLWDFEFFDNRLSAVIVSLKSTWFDRLAESLRQKYGPPRVEIIPAPQYIEHGTTVFLPAQEVHAWQDKASTLEFRKFDPDRDSSSLILLAPWYKERAARNQRNADKAKVKDL